MTVHKVESAEPPAALLPGLEDGAVVMIVREERKIYCPKLRQRVHRPPMGARLRYCTEGEITLRKGRLGGGDLLSDGYEQVFARRVCPGTYPVITVYAESAKDRVAAFGVIRLANKTAKKCKLALFEGEDPSEVTDDLKGGLGTDSGTIAVGEPDADDLNAPVEQRDSFREFIERGFEGDARCQIVAGLGGGSLCVWQPGFGDGVFTPYWGLSGLGQVCFFAVDFSVVANGLHAPAVKWDSVGESFAFRPIGS